MTKASNQGDYLIKDETMLRSQYGNTVPLAVKKCIPELDKHSRKFIKLSPFLCLSTQHANGTADVSPRGDPPGFVRILDAKTIVIPDRPGNNRLDSLSNIISNPAVGLLFLIPGFEETLRINGRAVLSQDPSILSNLAVNDRTPTLAIIVSINEVFLHCAKAFRRAKLWHAESQQDRGQLPSIAAMITEQTSEQAMEPAALAELEKELEEDYRNTMY